MNQHEILQDIKRVASDLGKIPTRRDYEPLGKFTTHQINKAFGGWSLALSACGFQGSINSKKPDLFKKDIEKHLEEYRNNNSTKETTHKEATQYENNKRPIYKIIKPHSFNDILVIGDCHFPFTNVDALTAIYSFIDLVKPKICVQMGDLYDMYAHSKFPKSQNLYMPDQEINLGFNMASQMWKKIISLSPGIECYQLLGNHDIRPIKRIIENYPEGEGLIKDVFNKWFTFEGVKTNYDYRQELILNEIVFLHGYRSSINAHRDFNQMNTVYAHTHKCHTSFRPYKNKIIWELNPGYIGDPMSKALGYSPQKINDWTVGFGYIDQYGPRAIVLE